MCRNNQKGYDDLVDFFTEGRTLIMVAIVLLIMFAVETWIWLPA